MPLVTCLLCKLGFNITPNSPAHSLESDSPCTKTGLTFRTFNLDAKITVPPHRERMCPWLLVLALLYWPVIHSNITLPLRLAPLPCPCEVRTDSEVPKSRSSELAQLSTSRKARPGAVPVFVPAINTPSNLPRLLAPAFLTTINHGKYVWVMWVAMSADPR